MFNVFVNDGTSELPPDDILYIVAKEGIFLKKKLGVMESIAPVKNISILNAIETMARMHITKIPAPMISKTIEFFRAINDEMKSEAIVLDFYDPSTGKHKIDAPFQKVSGASLDYTKPTPVEPWQLIGTIHSHNTMSAFHSSIDDADEKSFDGLHVTIGNVDEEFVSISASIVSNGTRFIVDPSEYIEGVKLVVDIDEEEEKSYGGVWKWNAEKKKMEQTKSTHTYKVKKFDKRYDVEASDFQKKFNKKWLKRVEKKEYTWRSYSYGGYGITHGGWGSHYDSSVWSQWKKDRDEKLKKTDSEVIDAKVKPADEKPKFTGKVEIIEKEDSNPCEECVFRNHKIEWVLENIVDEDGSPDGKEYWECLQCNTFFCTEDDDAINVICPECKDDTYLVEAEYSDFIKEKNDTNGTLFCEECGSEADADFFKDDICPFCKSKVIRPEQRHLSELTDEELHQLEISYSDPDRIPYPGGNSIPLNTPKKEKKGIFRSLFKGED